MSIFKKKKPITDQMLLNRIKAIYIDVSKLPFGYGNVDHFISRITSLVGHIRQEGRQEGRRDMLGWLKSNKGSEYLTPDGHTLITIHLGGLKAKLKEWGIKEVI